VYFDSCNIRKLYSQQPPERRHWYTTRPCLPFLMTDSYVHYIYNITAAGDSITISSQLGSSCQYGTEKAGGTAGPSRTTCRVTLQQSARRTAVFGQPSSLRPHWLQPCKAATIGRHRKDCRNTHTRAGLSQVHTYCTSCVGIQMAQNTQDL
jgi:hypothetical protein